MRDLPFPLHTPVVGVLPRERPRKKSGAIARCNARRCAQKESHESWFCSVALESTILLVLRLLLSRLLQLFLPQLVGRRLVDVREDELEDVAVPVDRLALDA